MFFGLTGTHLLNDYEIELSRTLDSLWNFGHLLLFFYFNYLLIRFKPALKNKSILVRLLIVFGLTTLLGVAIEVFQQTFMGGKIDPADLLKNYTGATAAFLFFWCFPYESVLKKILWITLLSLLFLELQPLAATAVDEYKNINQFPVISDLESETELERYSWTGLPLELSTKYISHGDHSAKIVFTNQKYSTVSLDRFSRDWSGYNWLAFDIFNPDSLLTLTCRINDLEHKKNNYAFADRYNSRIELKPGWNNIRIALADVLNAPASRKMNMKAVRNWAIFTTRLNQDRTIYLDFVRLE
ncbi:MAG: hypothetical protein KDF60_04465 [Calditrichaeota bacterium]|nr:hypothetical protein [Calditrichota bacterium]